MSESQYKLLSELLLPPISGSRPTGGVSADTEGVPSIGGENIVSAGGMDYEELKRVPESFFKSMPKGKLQTEDVLINKDGAQTGKVGYYDGRFDEAGVNEHVFILRARDSNDLTQSYLYYCVLLPATRRKIEKRITGSAQPGLNSQFVKAVDIPFPSLLKQRKIACILQTIDLAIEKTEALIEKYQQIKKGFMHDLFTRGIDANGQLRAPHEQAPELYQQTPIGWVPKEWYFGPLNSISSYQHGRPFPSTEYSDEGTLLLRPGNLHVSGYVVFDKSHSTRIPQSWEKVAPTFLVGHGDILMNLTAQSLDDEFLGRVCLYEDKRPALLNQRIARFKATTVEPMYLYWLLRSRDFRKQIDNTSQGTKVQHLYNRDLDRVVLGVPNDVKEQERIIIRLNNISAKIRSEEDSLHKLKLKKFGLMHDLLTGKVPVKVDNLEAVDV